MLDMRSEEIEQLLSSLKESCITEDNVVTILQKIRSDAMATKGGVQRLVKQACVQRMLKLLYRYVILDKSETEAEKSANEKKINTALSIVANLLMEKDARKQVKRDGMETLVSLLNDCHSEEVKIRCCRSLSNLAMDLPARSAMAQVKVVPALVKVLEVKYVEVEKPGEADTKAKDEIKESANEDVEVEAKFPSSAIVDAACKVARYIFGESKVRQQCVEAGMVARLAMLIKAEDSRLVAFVLRTLSELWTKMNKRITENMASEVSRAGIMAKLLEFVDSKDDKTSLQAFTILLPLAGHPRSAALIGACDGVEFFLSHLNSPRTHIVHKELISGLCLLAKEAVNRVKLRESGGLKVFLETLQDDAMLEVQDRVISCLVSFLYDDISLSTMLSERLVTILLSHLQRSGNYTSDMSVDLFTSAQALLLAETSASGHDTSKDNPQEDTATDNSCISDRLCSSKGETLKIDSKSLSKTQSEILVDVSGAQDQTCHKNTDPADRSLTDSIMNEEQKPGSSETAVEGSTSQENSEETEVASRSVENHTYSMNSPTYQTETSWRMEDYHPGVTCKSYNTSFSSMSPASNSDDSRNSFHPYSPLSTHSYFSPSTLHHSPLSSPNSSPAYSYATLSPAHSPCVSQGFASPYSSDGVRSEDLTHLSPSSTSPPGSSFHSASNLVFSSSEEEDSTENTDPGVSSNNITGSSANATTVPFTKVRFHLGQDERESSDPEMAGIPIISHPFGFLQDSNGSYSETAVRQVMRQGHETGRRFFRLPDNDGEPATKKQKLQHEAGVHGPITQNNILILLSRLSVRDDLSQHLTSPHVLICLTDHLALAEEPHDRCERILSRVMTSPHCFNPLLNMCAPAIVVRTLMLDSDQRLISHEAIASVRKSASGNRISRHLSVEDKDMRSRMMTTGASPNLSTESRGARPKSQSNASISENLESYHTSEKHTIRRMLSCDPAHDGVHSNQSGLAENTPEDKKGSLSLARMGSILLEDLSSQASSPYGEGVILHTFHCLTPARQLMCAASLLFLQSPWTRERRQKFLIQQGCLDKVVSSLCTQHSTDTAMKDALGLGLVYLARSLHIPRNFQTGDVTLLFTQALQIIEPPIDSALRTCDQEPSGPEQCNYAQAEKDLQIKIQKGSCCYVLHARRDTLVRNASVFSAMLQGSYIESTQSEISLSDVCPKAMTSVLHYLHHCGDQCSVLSSLADTSGSPFGMKIDQSTAGSSQTSHLQNKADKNKLKHILNMIVIADRFLLPELRQFLASVVSVSLVGANCVEEVFQFAAFHGLIELAEDCMQVLLSLPSSVADVTSSLTTLAEGQFGTCVMNSILSLVKRGIAHTP